jgi:hypothetical protein
MRCAYCNGPCDVRPVRMDAQCWECWFRNIGASMAIRKWRQRPAWRRIGPSWGLRWVGPLNSEKGHLRG